MSEFFKLAILGLFCHFTRPVWPKNHAGSENTQQDFCFGGFFTTIIPRSNIGCKRIPVTSAGLQNNGYMWKSLGGILGNIVPLEVPRPKALGVCGPSPFRPWNPLARDNIHQYTPSAFPYIVSVSVVIIHSIMSANLPLLYSVVGLAGPWG